MGEEQKNSKKENFTSLPQDRFEIWLKCRNDVMVIFSVQNFIIGLDGSFTFMTLWQYLTKVIKTEHPYLFYNLIFVSLFLPSILFVNILSRYVDRTRQVRSTFLVIYVVCIIGNLLWIVPSSPWYLVASRVLTGMGNTTRSVMSGETARSFPPDELSKKMAYLGVSYMGGYLIGPIMSFAFKGLRFHIGVIEITYMNFPGILIGFMLLLLFIFSLFKLQNISKMYDLKADRMQFTTSQEYNIESDEGYSDNGEIQSQVESRKFLLKKNKENSTERLRPKGILKQALTSLDVGLLLFLTLQQNYLQSLFYMWTPLLVLERLHWSVNALGVINGAVSVFTVSSFFILYRYRLNNDRLIYIGIFSQIAILIGQVLLTTVYYAHNFVINAIAWGLYSFLWTFMVICDEVFITTVLAQMVSSEYQISLDGLRLTSYRCGAVLGMLVSSFEYQKMFEFCIFHVLITIILIAIIVYRRKHLQNPSICIY